MTNYRTLATVAALALSAFAANAQSNNGASFGEGDIYPSFQSAPSTLTRAQVQAELAQAAKDGTLEMNDATYPVVADAVSTKTRAEVQRETLASSSTAGTVSMQN